MEKKEVIITIGSAVATIAGALFTVADFFLLDHKDIDTKIAEAVAAELAKAAAKK